MGLKSRLFPISSPAGANGGPFVAARIEELRTALGQASVTGLLALLADELRERPRAIAVALADNELSRARYESRTLAGAALNMGAALVGSAARRMEAAIALAQAGDSRAVAPALRHLQLSAREASRALPDVSARISRPERLAA